MGGGGVGDGPGIRDGWLVGMVASFDGRGRDGKGHTHSLLLWSSSSSSSGSADRQERKKSFRQSRARARPPATTHKKKRRQRRFSLGRVFFCIEGCNKTVSAFRRGGVFFPPICLLFYSSCLQSPLVSYEKRCIGYHAPIPPIIFWERGYFLKLQFTT